MAGVKTLINVYKSLLKLALFMKSGCNAGNGVIEDVVGTTDLITAACCARFQKQARQDAGR